MPCLPTHLNPARLWAPLLALLLAACAGGPPHPGDATDEAAEAGARRPAPVVALDGTAWLAASRVDGAAPLAQWAHQVYMNRQPTHYRATEHAGRPALLAEAAGANSTLSLALAPAPTPSPGTPPRRLQFSLFVPALDAAFNIGERGEDDAVARLILSFDGDRSQAWTARDHLLSELSNLVADKPLPYASIMYVWDNRYPVGTVIDNPHTRRVRQLVVQSGPAGLGRWVDHRRAVADDLMLTFGPARTGDAALQLSGLGVMSDANNTGARIDAWFGPLRLTGGAPSAIR